MRYQPLRERGRRERGLPAAIARQQGAEGGVQVAQPGLGRRPVVLVGRGAGVVLLPVRGPMVVEVPDRVRDGAVLRDQQQQSAQQVQDGSPGYFHRFAVRHAVTEVCKTSYTTRQAPNRLQAVARRVRAVYCRG
jgi:hypothetical protein